MHLCSKHILSVIISALEMYNVSGIYLFSLFQNVKLQQNCENKNYDLYLVFSACTLSVHIIISGCDRDFHVT